MSERKMEGGCAVAACGGGCGLWQPPRNMAQPRKLALPQALTAGGWVLPPGGKQVAGVTSGVPSKPATTAFLDNSCQLAP